MAQAKTRTMLRRVRDGYLFPNSKQLAKRTLEFVAVEVPEGVQAAWVSVDGHFLDARKKLILRRRKIRQQVEGEVSDLESGMPDEHGE